MQKDFDSWGRRKKQLNARAGHRYAHAREVWWCSIGVNIGVEADGKHKDFERPVLVLRVYNKESLLVAPLTTKEKQDDFHHRIATRSGTGFVKLTQVRVISVKRLLRKVGVVGEDEFAAVRTSLERFL